MTHIKNIPHILKNGITHQNSANRNKAYVSIGSNSLISKRENFKLANGKILGSYIPFYFGPRMPMLFVIKLGANSVKYNIESVLSEDIIYCITSVEQILKYDLRFVFSNGHAVNELTDFYDRTHISNINNLIDETAINAQYWTVESDLDLKRRKEAEFLIEEDIPLNAILGYAVYNEAAKQKLVDCGITPNKIVVKPAYYF